MGKSNEDLLRCQRDPDRRIPDGRYLAEFVRHDVGEIVKGAKRVFLFFRIAEGEYTDVELFASFNLGRKGPGPRSRYYATWTAVNGRPPRRRQVLSPRIFKGNNFWITTRTVDRDIHGNERPDDQKYSIIDRIEVFNP